MKQKQGIVLGAAAMFMYLEIKWTKQSGRHYQIIAHFTNTSTKQIWF